MKKAAVSLWVLVLVVGMMGCAGSVRRIAPDEVIDLSGRWNDVDSQLVAEEMIDDMLKRVWLTDFVAEHGKKKPRVIVGTIRNKTDEHIETEAFQHQIERELINDGRISFVSGKGERDELREEREDQQTFASEKTRKQMYKETGADYMLQGAIKKISDSKGSKSVSYYQVDLYLVDMETSEKVWVGEKPIKKFITKSGTRL